MSKGGDETFDLKQILDKVKHANQVAEGGLVKITHCSKKAAITRACGATEAA